jgi:hypothetical protein
MKLEVSGGQKGPETFILVEKILEQGSIEMKTIAPPSQAMTARERESALLARCAVAARAVAPAVEDQCEANVFRLAAMVVQSRFPSESRRLMQASEHYFAAHPDEQLSAAEVVGNGWVIGLPRLRDRLSRRLEED